MHYKALGPSLCGAFLPRGVKRSLLGLNSTCFQARALTPWHFMQGAGRAATIVYEQCQTIRPMQCVTKMDAKHKKPRTFIEQDLARPPIPKLRSIYLVRLGCVVRWC